MVIALRTHNYIDHGRSADDLAAFGLRHATGHSDIHFALQLHGAGLVGRMAPMYGAEFKYRLKERKSSVAARKTLSIYPRCQGRVRGPSISSMRLKRSGHASGWPLRCRRRFTWGFCRPRAARNT